MTTLLLAASLAVTNNVAETASVTIYASRIDGVKESIPASITVLSADDIGSSGARDMAELLKKKAGADIHSMNGNPLLTSVAMRGFGENAFGRIKIVLDGEELNNVDMSTPNLTRIALDNAERVEVIRGPSPVLYGDGAVAGVVNVVSDSEDYTEKTKLSAKAGSQYTYGGNMKTKGGIEEEGLQYSAAYDYLQSEGYRRRSAYDIHTANASLRRNFANGSVFGVKANYQNAFYELPGSLTFDQWKMHPRSAANEHDWTKIWSYGTGFNSKMKLADGQWLRIDGGFSHQHRHAKMYEWGTDAKYDYYSYALSPRYVNENYVSRFENMFTAGIDIRYDRYGERAVPDTKRRFDRFRFAAFGLEEFHLTEDFSITAGARIERIDNRWKRYGGLRESSGDDLMSDFELGIVYRPAEDIKLYAKGARFHRSAFCDEMCYTRDGGFLEPETGYSADAGAEWLFLEEFSLELNGYGMIMEDEIFFDPLILPFGYNCNSPAKTRRAGLDVAISWQREKTAEASLRYGTVHADFGSGAYHGYDIPYVPNHRVRLEGGYWIFPDLEIKGGYSFTSSQYVSGDYTNSADKLPGYSLFDIGAYYVPSWAEGWKASFTLDNIFDRNYCDYAGIGYYYPACGRSFMFTISYEF